jgi:hypothetical protein
VRLEKNAEDLIAKVFPINFSQLPFHPITATMGEREQENKPWQKQKFNNFIIYSTCISAL